MSESDTGSAAAPQPGTAAKFVTPILGLAVTWGVRRALDSAYRRSTGTGPPRAGDPEVPLAKVLMWAAMSAAVLAVANVVVDRLTAHWE